MMQAVDSESARVEQPRVTAIILNWNGWQDTIACLASLAQSTYPVHPIVVDNGSTDESLPQLRAAYPDLSLIPLPMNTGYAGGVAVGVDEALRLGSDYLLLINNDAVLDPCMVTLLLEAAEQNPRLAIVAPTIYRDGGTSIWALGAHWDYFRIREIREMPPVTSSVVPLDVVYACISLIRAQDWQQFGGFDQRFFAYYEDVDLCLRLRDRGRQVAWIPNAKAWHKVSSSTQDQPQLKVFYEMQSRVQLFKKRLRRQDFYVFCLHELRYMLSRAVRYLGAGDKRHALALVHGAWSGLRDKSEP